MGGEGQGTPWLWRCSAAAEMELVHAGRSRGGSAKHRGQREALDICWTADTGGKLGGHGRGGSSLLAVAAVKKKRQGRKKVAAGKIRGVGMKICQVSTPIYRRSPRVRVS
jgi:hypothetical protein